MKEQVEESIKKESHRGKRYPDAFKSKALNSLQKLGPKVTATKLKISPSILYRWQRNMASAAQAEGPSLRLMAGTPKTTNDIVARQQQEIKRLRSVIVSLLSED